MSDTLTARDKYHLKKYGSVDSPVRLAMKNGGSVVEHRDTLIKQFKNGGFTNTFPWEENPNTPENRIEAEAYNRRQEQRTRDKENEFNNPSTRRLVGEALQLPYRWLSNPQRIIGDITGDRINPNSRKDILEDRRNSINGQSNINRAIWGLPSAIYNTASLIYGGPKQAASMLASNYMADSNILEGTGTATGIATGWPNNQLMRNFSEEAKRSGGMTDFKQAIENYEKGDYAWGVANTLSGIGGVFDTSGAPRNSIPYWIDKGLEATNYISDAIDIARPVYPYVKDIPSKVNKAYSDYKKKQEIDRQRTESARKNKEADARRESDKRIRENGIIIPSEANNYRMFKPKNELKEITVTGKRKK
jgi:hypothetical protein